MRDRGTEPPGDGPAYALVALLGAAGITHLLAPGIYEGIVPHALPGSRRGWTLVSGVAELVCCVLVARRESRRLGAGLAALLFVLVFPANVQMALDWRHRGRLEQLVAWSRLPLQVVLVCWALRVRARAGGRTPSMKP